VTPAQQAYSLLWRSNTDDPYVKKAQAVLRESLTREERIEAVKWLMNDPFPNDLPTVR